MSTALIIIFALAIICLAGYLAGCAGAGRMLTFKEWWGAQ